MAHDVESLKFVAGQATAAMTPRELKSLDPHMQMWVIGDDVLEKPIPKQPRDHKAHCLDEIISLANRFKDEDGASPVVWYNDDAVTLILNDADHRDNRVIFDMGDSAAFLLLSGLGFEDKFSIKQFRKLLRVQLAPYLPAPELLDKIKRITFENGTLVTSQKERSQESMGREIKAIVGSTDKIPESVTLNVPVFSDTGERDLTFPFRCYVEIDPEEQICQLIPYPDEAVRVRGLAILSIAERLAEGLDESVPRYHGEP